jgi:hypothetical protein
VQRPAHFICGLEPARFKLLVCRNKIEQLYNARGVDGFLPSMAPDLGPAGIRQIDYCDRNLVGPQPILPKSLRSGGYAPLGKLFQSWRGGKTRQRLPPVACRYT